MWVQVFDGPLRAKASEYAEHEVHLGHRGGWRVAGLGEDLDYVVFELFDGARLVRVESLG